MNQINSRLNSIDIDPFHSADFPKGGNRSDGERVLYTAGRESLLALAFALLTFLALLCCGCQVLSYSGPNGERFTRSSLGANISISSLTLEAGTNGLRQLDLRGYQNDSSQALGVVTEAAVRGALQAK